MAKKDKQQSANEDMSSDSEVNDQDNNDEAGREENIIDDTEMTSDVAEEEAGLPELMEELGQAKAKAEENWNLLVLAKADAENQQRRSKRDVENAHKYAAEKFIQGVLPVIDSLEMGMDAAKLEGADIATLLEGSELTLKMFQDTLTKFDVERIEPTGEAFDPEFHQAMSIQETADSKPNTVLATMQKGYLLNKRLIRPAMVVVSKELSAKNDEKDKMSASEGEKVGTNVDEKA